MNLDQGDIALMVANARGLAALGMAGGYDEVLYELSDALDALHERAEAAEAEAARLRDGLREIARRTYPARYLGEAKDGTKMYGGTDDASRFARALLAEDGAA